MDLIYYFLLLPILMGQEGCYGTMSHDMPMLREQYDLRVDMSLSLTSATIGTAYAFDDHWGIQGSIQERHDIWRRLGGQVSTGWFTTLSNNKIVEVYAGASLGHSLNRTPDDIHYYGFQSYFLQADYGWIRLSNSHIDFAFGLKGGWLTGEMVDEYSDTPDNRTLNISKPFIEPTLQFRAGGQHLKFNLYMGITICDAYDKNNYFTSPLPHGGIGVNYYFNTQRK